MFPTNSTLLKIRGSESDTVTKASRNRTRWMCHGTSSWTVTFEKCANTFLRPTMSSSASDRSSWTLSWLRTSLTRTSMIYERSDGIEPFRNAAHPAKRTTPGRPSSWNTSCKLLTFVTPCSIGMCTNASTKSCLRNSWWHTVKDVVPRILPTFGTKGNSSFLTITWVIIFNAHTHTHTHTHTSVMEPHNLFVFTTFTHGFPPWHFVDHSFGEQAQGMQYFWCHQWRVFELCGKLFSLEMFFFGLTVNTESSNIHGLHLFSSSSSSSSLPSSSSSPGSEPSGMGRSWT